MYLLLKPSSRCEQVLFRQLGSDNVMNWFRADSPFLRPINISSWNPDISEIMVQRTGADLI